MKVHETRSQANAPSDEGQVISRKQKAESKAHEGDQQSPKKAKNGNQGGRTDGKSDIVMEYENFCKAIREHLSIEQMREILEMNEQDSSGSDEAVITKCQDLLFFGPLDNCPLCNSTLEFDGKRYSCKVFYSEWSSCTFRTKNPPRKEVPVRSPDSVLNSPVRDLLKKYQDPSRRPCLGAPVKHLAGIVIALSGRLSRTHQSWKEEIEKHEGKFSNSIQGITCVVVCPAERNRGGSCEQERK